MLTGGAAGFAAGAWADGLKDEEVVETGGLAGRGGDGGVEVMVKAFGGAGAPWRRGFQGIGEGGDRELCTECEVVVDKGERKMSGERMAQWG